MANIKFIDDRKLNSGILHQNILRVAHRLLFVGEVVGHAKIG